MGAVANRVKEVTSTEGTGPYLLEGASIGYRTFYEAFNNESKTYAPLPWARVDYCCEAGADWEVGEGYIMRDPHWDMVVLNLPFASDLLDSKSRTITNNAVTLSNAFYFFEGASDQNMASFNGTTSYLEIANSPDFNFGTGDFAIEVVIRLLSSAADFVVIGNWSSTDPTSWKLMYNATLLTFDFVIGNTTVLRSAPRISATGNVNISVSRRSGKLALFWSNTWQMDTSTVYDITSTQPLSIGRQGSTASAYFNGMLSKLRVTKGESRHRSMRTVYTVGVPFPTSATPQLYRRKIFDSSNNKQPVNWPAGPKTIYSTVTFDRLHYANFDTLVVTVGPSADADYPSVQAAYAALALRGNARDVQVWMEPGNYTFDDTTNNGQFLYSWREYNKQTVGPVGADDTRTDVSSAFRIYGAPNIARNIVGVFASSYSAPNITYQLTLNDVTGISIGHFVMVQPDAANGTNPQGMHGLWKISAVDTVNKRITCSTEVYGNYILASGLCTGTARIIRTVVRFTGTQNAGALVDLNNVSRPLIQLTDIVFERVGTTTLTKTCIQCDSRESVPANLSFRNVGVYGMWWAGVALGNQTRANAGYADGALYVSGRMSNGINSVDGSVFMGCWVAMGMATTMSGASGIAAYVRNSGRIESGGSNCFVQNCYYSVYVQGSGTISVGPGGQISSNYSWNGSAQLF